MFCIFNDWSSTTCSLLSKTFLVRKCMQKYIWVPPLLVVFFFPSTPGNYLALGNIYLCKNYISKPNTCHMVAGKVTRRVFYFCFFLKRREEEKKGKSKARTISEHLLRKINRGIKEKVRKKSDKRTHWVGFLVLSVSGLERRESFL